MIITLKGATFTTNIGTLNTWRVATEVGSGATYSGPTSVTRNPVTGLNATITVAEGYELGSAGVTVTMGGVGQTYTINGNVITISIAQITGNVYIKVPTVNTATGEEDNGGNDNTDNGETNANVVFDFDFTKSTLADYADDGIFTVPDNATLDSIAYDANGANLNNNLPNGLNLVNPIDASRAWTLEFTANFATPSDLVGNRRAFLTGSSAVSGAAMTPFVVINATKLDSLGFQISNGNHVYVGGGQLAYDAEASYKLVHDGTGVVTVSKNGTDIGNVTVNFAGSQFEVLLGTASGKSTAYVWKDVEDGKKSYLKKIKFYYN